MSKENKLPELLLPAGNVENFRAAIQGGADAIYLGLRKFNARGRASNFTYLQFVTLLNEAKKNNVKVYVTVNTVIKNSELPDLMDMLWFLSKTSVSAVIIQDWGVYYLLRKSFPKLVIHASTQMGNHNSIGANYSKRVGIERVILAREITEKELFEISSNSNIELEIFTHGALCYSFSGMCMFSSYVGGAGANRGICTQNCRRAYKDNKEKYLFSLKDFQLIEQLPQIIKAGVASVKIEGRMKSAEYVYTVASAYRKALDNNRSIIEAKKELRFDMGREKTGYFFGGNVSNAITPNPNTGIYLGQIVKRNDNQLFIESNKAIEEGFRIRVVSRKTDQQINLKVKVFSHRANNLYVVEADTNGINKNDKVFLIGGVQTQKFSNKIRETVEIPEQQMPKQLKNSVLGKLRTNTVNKKETLFVRIDSLKWMRKIWFDNFDFLILNLSLSELKEFNPTTPFIKKNRHKIFIEIPKFIPEGKVKTYKNICNNLFKNGVNNFMLSHISQKLLIPQKANFATNENVYVFNDAASKFIVDEGAKFYIYPLENDFGNYYSQKNREGVVPMYSHPDLFLSRMPVKVESEKQTFVDDTKRIYEKTVRDGLTIVRPELAVATLQHKQKFQKLGYHKFLLDFTGESPSKNVFNKVLLHFKSGQAIQNTTTFNLKRELK